MLRIMRTMRALFVTALPLAAVVVFACTGEDPVAKTTPSTNEDASTFADATVTDAGSEAASPEDGGTDASCAMRPFGVLSPVNFAITPTFAPRLMRYGQPDERALYVVDYNGAGSGFEIVVAPRVGAQYGNATVIASLSTPSDEWAPSATDEGNFIVFTRGAAGQRRLFTAVGDGGLAFGTPTAPFDAGTDDEADGFLVPQAVYFARRPAGANGLSSVYRAPRPGGGASFGEPTQFHFKVGADVAVPVVDARETTMLYATGVNVQNWVIEEVRLVNGAVSGPPMLHTEFAGMPWATAWLSPDGCTLVASQGVPTVTTYLARR